MRRTGLLGAVVLALVLAVPARGDGDPASDILPQQNVFFPYSPPVSKPYGPALVDLLERAHENGFRLKVALIQSPSDLGAYPQLFNKPQEYADLLYSELITSHGQKKFPLLVIMPAGFGGKNLGGGVDGALEPVEIDAEAETDGLARAALEAVARLSTANGHPLEVPPAAFAEADEAGDGGGTSPLVFIVPLLLVALGAAAAGRIAQRRAREQRALADRVAAEEGEADEAQAGEDAETGGEVDEAR